MIKEDIFLEVLNEWYWAEHSLITEFSTECDQDYKKLDNKKDKYMKLFIEAK